MTLLSSVAVFLGATLIAVPLFKRLKLGAILGYLVAGVLIGPSAFNLIDDPQTILHFAELGVVLLLFVIGLELEPTTLWRMRNQILLSGGSQLIVSALIIGAVCYTIIGLSLYASITIGLALALSSTAFAIQLMNSHGILHTPPGQQGFSILLMQDVAVLIIGRFLVNPFLQLIARYGSSEVMTAAALFLVLVTALAMSSVGLSMGMGAFIAGILLADSSFKHQLETEIEPFKGLLLGLFFIAIGMNLDLSLLASEPAFIFLMSFLLVFIKSMVIMAIMLITKQSARDSTRIGLMLSQGGEFAFVVMTLALSSLVVEPDIAARVNLVVGLSMAFTSPLVIIYAKFFNTKHCPPVYDTENVSNEPQVIIAGFGRFGQITARVLAANKINFTALDKDAEHIAFVKKFGNKVFFGDATRIDLLKKAGIDEAKILLIAIDNQEEITRLANIVKRQFSHITVIVRSRNRDHTIELSKAGINTIIREVYDGGLRACGEVLKAYGYSERQSDHMTQMFAHHDEKMLQEVIKQDLPFDGLVNTVTKGRQELEQLFLNDKQKD